MLKLLILLAAVGTVIEGDLLDGYSCTEGSTKRVCKGKKTLFNIFSSSLRQRHGF